MSRCPPVGYITIYDSTVDASPSKLPGMRGAGYYLAEALMRRGVDLGFLGPLESQVAWYSKIRWRLEKTIFNRSWFVWLDHKLLDEYARQVDQRIRDFQVKVLLCPQNFWPVARIKSQLPLVLYTDAPLGVLLEMPGYFGVVSDSTRSQVLELEGQAFRRCACLVFPSQWAAERACALYSIPKEKVFVVPYGGNLPSMPQRENVLAGCAARSQERCELLYVGLGWQRKGLMTAVAVAEALEKSGIPVRLTVVGDFPESLRPPTNVRLLGLVNRTTDQGWESFVELFSSSHFLLLPTKADISPFVLCEANAFGLPCLATNVGGIPSIVRDGVNGYVVELDENVVSALVKTVSRIWGDPDTYQSLCRSTLEEFETRLNWDRSASRIEEILEMVAS